jgi:hypothetical protein
VSLGDIAARFWDGRRWGVSLLAVCLEAEGREARRRRGDATVAGRGRRVEQTNFFFTWERRNGLTY